jgi:YD repeat-containing protein
LTSITYPDSSKVTRSYHAAKQLTDVTDWNGNDTHFGYDADGNLTSESFPSSTNGAEETYSYNAADELTKIIASRTTGSNPFRWVFGSGRDGVGQVSSATDRSPGMRHTYAYDALNRLTQDTRANRTAQSWSYNAADELTGGADTALGTTSTYTYNGGDQLTSLQTTQGSSTLQNLTLSYNTVGDRTGQSDRVSGTTLTFGYNQDDELTSYANSKTGMSATYSYNGDGLRTSKTVNGGSPTAEVWDLAEGMPLVLQEGTTRYVISLCGYPIERNDQSPLTPPTHPGPARAAACSHPPAPLPHAPPADPSAGPPASTPP